MASKIRLHQFLRASGRFQSKKEALEAVKKGEISIDGKVIQNPEYQFKKKAEVTYLSEKITIPDEIYLVLNKPVRYICHKLTDTDREMRKRSIFDLPKLTDTEWNSLISVGRLDEMTSGLIILTTDGKFSNWLTRGEVPKTYHAVLEANITRDDVIRIQKGIEIKLEDDGIISTYLTKPCTIGNHNGKDLNITLREGKKREVRRIFEAVGTKVVDLERISIGKMRLSDLGLKKGDSKRFEKSELIDKIIHGS